MKKSRSRKSNIQSIEVKVKQQHSLPTGNELSLNESLSQEAREKYPESCKNEGFVAAYVAMRLASLESWVEE